jgi:nucleoside-diphosphate-sugar epimerase
MKIFIAGASGAIGSQLVPQLVVRGHEVVGTTRSAAKTDALRALGAEPVIVDALDPDSVADVVAKAEPEVIVHQLTALSGPVKLRQVRRMAATTNRLRTEGTDHLLAAGRAVGARRFVAQSNYALLERAGEPVADENAPDRAEPAQGRQAGDGGTSSPRGGGDRHHLGRRHCASLRWLLWPGDRHRGRPRAPSWPS